MRTLWDADDGSLCGARARDEKYDILISVCLLSCGSSMAE